MDKNGMASRKVFMQILRQTMPGSGHFPFNAIPWDPKIDLIAFVHRVEGLAPGLYLLLRSSSENDALRLNMNDRFAWETATSSAEALPLYMLAEGDVRSIARQLSCGQAIASDSCFSLGMVAHFEAPLRQYGPWFYRRLFWECGVIGQVLYLEAEAAGIRGTGIGCFFDDAVHEMLGLETDQHQSLYHFTVGHPVEDARLTTLPAYS
jgi:hypothetical protein